MAVAEGLAGDEGGGADEGEEGKSEGEEGGEHFWDENVVGVGLVEVKGLRLRIWERVDVDDVLLACEGIAPGGSRYE